MISRNKSQHAVEEDQDERPLRTLVNSWVFQIMLPAAAISWTASRRLSVTFGATILTPAIAILQGALGILRYRVLFGDCPVPITPSHGVVMVRPPLTSIQGGSQGESGEAVEEENEAGEKATMAEAEEKGKQSPMTPLRSSDEVDVIECEHSQELLREATRQPPVRVLMIGDSLAIGVGQTGSSTPIMPEVIAKTLSKRLGRVVYWTCHGFPGASTGWIVRDIEHGFSSLKKEEDEPDDDDEMDMSVPVASSCSETESSSDESSNEGANSLPATRSSSRKLAPGADGLQSFSYWRRRLSQHSKRFSPDVLGPYDIVVVLTGSNDLKSAFFPFLLKGDDAELRRQARERGGCYSNELRRLVETLNRKMREHLALFRHTVMESVRDTVEGTIELIAPGSSHHLPMLRHYEKHPQKPHAQSFHHAVEDVPARHHPLIVLPGMQSRALPIFRSIPLRWLSVPIVDAMDAHKRDLARAHPGEVLFVPAPPVRSLGDFAQQQGEFWRERSVEKTVFSIRDVTRHECREREQEMHDYYESKKQALAAERTPILSLTRIRWMMPFLSCGRQAPVASMFAVDHVHPNDKGYECWGRYIGGAISDEWIKLHPQNGLQRH